MRSQKSTDKENWDSEEGGILATSMVGESSLKEGHGVRGEIMKIVETYFLKEAGIDVIYKSSCIFPFSKLGYILLQELANYDPLTKSDQMYEFINKVLLEHIHACSFTCCL